MFIADRLTFCRDLELFKSKGVAHALQRVHQDRPATNPHLFANDQVPIGLYGRDSTLSGRPPSSINQYSLNTPISHFGVNTSLTRQIENPISTLQEYCKANMIPIDIKAEECPADPNNPDQRKLYRAWVVLDNEETKISDVYAYTIVDARRRATQRALEALMKKQPSHVNETFLRSFVHRSELFSRSSAANQWSP